MIRLLANAMCIISLSWPDESVYSNSRREHNEQREMEADTIFCMTGKVSPGDCIPAHTLVGQLPSFPFIKVFHHSVSNSPTVY